MENAGWLPIDCYMDEAKIADYDACIFPGGCWNPDFLRACRSDGSGRAPRGGWQPDHRALPL
jgi:hypothetical protein